MSRRLKVSSAQLGPIHRADSRASVVKRMIEMLKEAAALMHWQESLRGIAIEVTYRDIVGSEYTYSRTFLENV